MSKIKSPFVALRYPLPLSLAVEIITAIFSAITVGIVGYFLYYLSVDNWHVPWEFIFLTAISSITLLAHIAIFASRMLSISTHFSFRFLPPIITTTIILQTILAALWAVGLAVITVKLRPMVLSHTCTKSVWRTDNGVMVCHIYKALYTSVVVSTAGCGTRFILEAISVISNQGGGMALFRGGARGDYMEMKDDKSTKLQDYQAYQQWQHGRDTSDQQQQLHGRESRFEPFRGAEQSSPPIPLERRFETERIGSVASGTMEASTIRGSSTYPRASVSSIGRDGFYTDQTEHDVEDDVGSAMLKSSPRSAEFGQDTSYHSRA